jgi:hypothetical protein
VPKDDSTHGTLKSRRSRRALPREPLPLRPVRAINAP